MVRPARIAARVLVVVALGAWCGGASADDSRGWGEIGFDVGAGRFAEDLGGEVGTRLGVRLGWYANRIIEGEVQLASMVAREELLPGADQETRFSQLLLNVLLNGHPGPRVEPYALLSAGFGQFEVRALGFVERDFDFAVGIGGGSRFFFTSAGRTAFRIEAVILAAQAFGENRVIPSFTGGFTWGIGRRR